MYLKNIGILMLVLLAGCSQPKISLEKEPLTGQEYYIANTAPCQDPCNKIS